MAAFFDSIEALVDVLNLTDLKERNEARLDLRRKLLKAGEIDRFRDRGSRLQRANTDGFSCGVVSG